MIVAEMIDAAARRDPDKVMLEYREQSWSYSRIVAASHAEADRLSAAGIGKGDVVAALPYNTPEFFVAMLAIWRLGAILVPVNHKLAPPECDYILTHSGAKFVYASKALLPVLEQLSLTIPVETLESIDLDVAPEIPSASLRCSVDPADAAEILYTSGTTGRPKGCVHSHHSMSLTALVSALGLSMTPFDRTLIAMPIWHAGPLNNFSMGTFFVNGTVVLMREYEPEEFLRTLQDKRITVYFGAPVSFSLPLAREGGLSAFDFSHLRVMLYGGGPIGPELSLKLANEYRTDRFYHTYGMTETGPGGTLLHPEDLYARPGSIGRPIAGIEMRLVVDARDARPGEVGEIWLKSPTIMKGYLNNPEATAEVLADGWYKTGDLARSDEDGFLYIVDRLKDLIVTGGENVYSKEIEDVLQGIDGIADCAVIGLPHDEWGETVAAFYIPAGNRPVSEEALRTQLAGQLAGYKVPRRFEAVTELPRTPSGKVQKHILRDHVSDLLTPTED
tara:strand:- start:1932 stop:3440 length:1509 start_codon:yes stop_codon:yes gene_type:complete